MPKKQTIPVTVRAITQLTPRIREYVLARADGGPLPAYEAGAHIEVMVSPDSTGDTVRHYSLSGDTSAAGDGRHAWRIAVQREDRARGSAHIHQSLEAGSSLCVSAPKNEFRLDHRDGNSLLIAGGIGITPILAMLRSLVHRKRAFEIAYTGRSRSEMAYVETVQILAGPHAHIHCNDEGGLFDLKALLAAQPAHTSAYVCGPAGLIDAVRAAAAALGWDAQRVRSELFTPPPTGDEVAFDVVLKQSGQTVRVAAGASILDALKNAGQHPLFDCRRGECGLCPLTVLEADGPIVHRDRYLSDDEKAAGKTLCICVSRLQGSRIVLDA